ncbi:MAG: phosphoenolpyruvate--protein phosphotransferase [Ignavibacteriota bacterium]|nr:MAG: phosphoenolpyruvate--protein phosphotransferase [Chlorobiota bacterium]MBE7478140.1 phosphoenolpyruvate--protein phosphotransferase [Ignavibacteriales bacterium]MBL1121630.1 phosphoenolpyruvate--protein phosphotransferase [Ignavibacteriota bacterium]MCC7092727.1 phosphoenolpyruvate--protein phosphotransferase [Ignavibacteriaceae bacterium]MCE7856699.1 phosphoenolpyruvate--protein phosphotransferase [Ignavibacteria bacterium CHB3]MEB2296637.1 phosphoenolpyruvate--protein phosphotransfer
MKSFKDIYRQAENKISGLAAAPGIIIGEAYLYTKEKLQINKADIDDIEKAKNDLVDAIAKSKKELNKVFVFAREKMDEVRAAIFEAQLMILDDPILLDEIIGRIEKEKKSPEFIVDDEISKYQNKMILSHESYMKERALDIEDIKQRIVRNLQKKRWESKIEHNVIVVSESLTPADTILLTRNKVLAFITDHGGLTSHAAIISRSLNIPAVVGTHNATAQIKDNDEIVVDGFYGYVIVNPTEEQKEFFVNKRKRLLELQHELEELKDEKAITKDGREIKLFANVDVSGEIDMVVTSGANGIGLYRTEQILHELGEFPNEDEQTIIYSKLASRIYPSSITIRVFDIGGDKFRFLDFEEPNPFLGLRGIRLLLENPALFKTQIRAILKSSLNKNVRIMIPMVSTLKEISEAKRIIEECKSELLSEKIKFDEDIKVGIMIEVPSAAVMARELSREVDFVSIGTNDLVQYLMAVDRGNDLVADLYQEFSPAVISTLKHIIDETKKSKKPVSLCGELAADTLAMPLLLGLGLDSLSMSTPTIPYAKRIIRSCEYKKAKRLVTECLKMHSEEDVKATIEKFFKKNNITRTRQII